jgi:MoaA/NifB/PqqE/SkfB family radical SAM enzyme
MATPETDTVLKAGKASPDEQGCSALEPSIEDLTAPLYIAWQITNECNLACLHCIEESGPGKAFKDELRGEALFAVLRKIVDGGVPYVAISGGEPMVHPDFDAVCEYLGHAGVNLKIETNGHPVTRERAGRMRDQGVRGVQVSIDGGSAATHERMRVYGKFGVAVEAARMLVDSGVPVEITFVPAAFSIHEVGRVIDLAYEIGAMSFYSGPVMRTGNAVKTWKILEPSEEQYRRYFEVLREKAQEYEGRMRVYYHATGIVEELKYRLKKPAALFILLPNGKVKLVNALPFLCGDLRSQSLSEVWTQFKRAWRDPRVVEFVNGLDDDPKAVSRLHQWVELFPQ